MYLYLVSVLKKEVLKMISGISTGSEVGKSQTEPQGGELKDGSVSRQADIFTRWQTAYRLAETYALLNQSKPSFEAQFKVDQVRELFLSLSEDYVTLGMTKDRFPGAPVVPHSVQQQLDEFGQSLDRLIMVDRGDLPEQRRKVLGTLLDANQTDSVVGIRLSEDLYEKCQNLGISTNAAIDVTDQFKSFRETVAARLCPDRNYLKGLASDLWDQLAEGASAETEHAQERADKRAKLLHLDEDLYGYGQSAEISSRASSDEIVHREQRNGMSWHTVDSSSGNSNAYFKASPARSGLRPETLRRGPSDTDPVRGQAPEKPPEEQAALSELWRKKLNGLERDFNALEENHSNEQIETWLDTVADAETKATPPVAEIQRSKRAASEIPDSQSMDDHDRPSLKRPKMDERDDRSSTASRA
jgi:hypothetical protein